MDKNNSVGQLTTSTLAGTLNINKNATRNFQQLTNYLTSKLTFEMTSNISPKSKGAQFHKL